MPKIRNPNSLSSNRARVSPYHSHLNPDRRNCSNKSEILKDRLDETRCSVCMEHLNNAVLLICSSHEQGCRPYMCDSSHRYSSCFDQVCKIYGVAPSESTSAADQPNGFVCSSRRANQTANLVCPLCWGNISEWIVVRGAGGKMDSRVPTYALEIS